VLCDSAPWRLCIRVCLSGVGKTLKIGKQSHATEVLDRSRDACGGWMVRVARARVLSLRRSRLRARLGQTVATDCLGTKGPRACHAIERARSAYHRMPDRERPLELQLTLYRGHSGLARRDRHDGHAPGRKNGASAHES
jgi:hypothetical protein